jgi:hypothetical protein
MGQAKGAPSKHQKADDLSVSSSEALWRLIDPNNFELDPNTKKPDLQKLRSTLSGTNISALRLTKLDQHDPIAHVQRVMPGYGIGELSLAEIRKPNNKGHICIVNIEDEEEWPPEAHVCIYKCPGNPELTQIQKHALTEALANKIIREPDKTKMRPRGTRPPRDPNRA